MWGIFKKQDTNEKLIKNIEKYEQKKRQEQSQASTIKRDKLNRQKDKKS
tara:strand:+ start:97 stop:243 length:147 start_codon:yes stop_codon:yes gene_type:complete